MSPSSPWEVLTFLGGWRRLTDEAFDFTNWASGEPDHLGGNEDVLQIHGAGAFAIMGTWNDGDGSAVDDTFVVEFVPGPGTLSLLLFGGIVAIQRRR